ncbi:hypothetical protein C1645_829708 [Glomus cerebriforme]|uniref:Uncharacterized protein n=1 Tax=Glomus cerebriforme TaxID=658196 RepID=A0A397SKG9_9GLOM|nr:hypothetical protein C1645_829708 [Glomus cerebriforme]
MSTSTMNDSPKLRLDAEIKAIKREEMIFKICFTLIIICLFCLIALIVYSIYFPGDELAIQMTIILHSFVISVIIIIIFLYFYDEYVG